MSPNKYRLTYNATRHIKLNDSFADSSGAPIDQPLSLLNIVYASLIAGAKENAKDMDAQTQAVLFGTVNKLAERYNETLMMKMSAREALLGRAAPIINRLRRIADTFGVEAQVPHVNPETNMFGVVTVMNGTWQGPFEIYTGYQATASSLGDLISYQGKRRLTYFSGRCNRLQTSAGELRPIPIGSEQVLEMYQPSFCRAIHLKPVGVRKLREGLAIGYVVAPDDLLAANLNPDNRCFCVNGTSDDYCSLSGVIQLAPCVNFAPLIVALNSVPLDRKMADSIQDFDEDLLRDDVDHLTHAISPAQFVVLRRLGLTIEADLTVTLFVKVERDARFR